MQKMRQQRDVYLLEAFTVFATLNDLVLRVSRG